MTAQDSLPLSAEERRAQREAAQKLANQRFGLFLFQACWILVFVCLIVVNWSVRTSFPTWPPPNVQQLGVVLPTLATALLLVSAWTARQGLQRTLAADVPGLVRWWGVTLALAIVFVGIMLFECVRVPGGNQYTAVFRLMTVFHAVHAVAIGVYLLNTWVNARYTVAVAQGRKADDGHVIPYGPGHFWSVEAGTKLWYFVVVAWIMFYAVLYLWRS